MTAAAIPAEAWPIVGLVAVPLAAVALAGIWRGYRLLIRVEKPVDSNPQEEADDA